MDDNAYLKDIWIANEKKQISGKIRSEKECLKMSVAFNKCPSTSSECL